MTHDVAGFLFRLKGTRRSKYLKSSPKLLPPLAEVPNLGRTSQAQRLAASTCGSVLPPLSPLPLSPRISETTPEKGRKSGIQNPESESEGHCTRGRCPKLGNKTPTDAPQNLTHVHAIYCIHCIYCI